MENLKKCLLDEKLITIIRDVKIENMEPLVEALYKGGVRFIEVTLNTENALSSIEFLRKKYNEKMYIGAGTVLSLNFAKQAIDAGAQFLVTPNINEKVIRFCSEQNILILPGAMTPTEIVNALEYGSNFIKLFPAGSMGANYVKELRGPFKDVFIFPVGGVTLENIPDFLKAGANGFGIGGNLCNLENIANKRFDLIEQNSREFLKCIRSN